MKKFDSPVYITRSSLAPLEAYKKMLEGPWESSILTHNGPLVQQLEKELAAHDGLEHMVAVTNGTVALQVAIKALGVKGEIITTPFTWIATGSAIAAEGCRPVFADIDPYTLNIDPAKIEERITKHTVAIMPVHVFSNPCDIEAIEEIANRHNLKVIYDGAHAYSTFYKGRPLLEYGDVSTTSFHATKIFNTGEGGGCVTRDADLAKSMQRIRFFGHDDSRDIVDDGFNGKMTEIHAALGLVNLKYHDDVLADRKRKYQLYLEELGNVESLRFQKFNKDEYNYSYMPVIFKDEETLLHVEKTLNEYNVIPRRYFYPSINTYRKVFTYESMPVSEDVSKRILCLPLYFELPEEYIYRITEIIRSALNFTENGKYNHKNTEPVHARKL